MITFEIPVCFHMSLWLNISTQSIDNNSVITLQIVLGFKCEGKEKIVNVAIKCFTLT